MPDLNAHLHLIDIDINRPQFVKIFPRRQIHVQFVENAELIKSI